MRLPEAIVMEILAKLPIKSVMRFISVCKHWCSYSQTPYFSTQHRHYALENNRLCLLVTRLHSTPRSQVLYFSQFSTHHNIQIPFLENCECVRRICGPCNGLLCLHNDDDCAIWNPSTREIKILPRPHSGRGGDSWIAAAFDLFNFGFDYTTHDYIVIKVFVSPHKDEQRNTMYKVELYSLKTNSWKIIFRPLRLDFNYKGFSTCINRCFYWMRTSTICAFDLRDEKFSNLTYPCDWYDPSSNPSAMFDLDGSLTFVFGRQQGAESSFAVWVMNGSWTQIWSIESVFGVEGPLGFWKNGELCLQGCNNQELLVFDPVIGEFKGLGIDACGVITFVENIVSINGKLDMRRA
ncbi:CONSTITUTIVE EXPRESSER OF PR GENES 1, CONSTITUTIVE EXPRESSER OF PR GENES 30 [Hibiscus trionum]|uniref:CONSTITUTIVE EXPRESSER OF PR GENES 1, CONSTITUTIVE EXPRESSER OF PR GENES 30 n=1 Tax=Hibiscus trionum TaxID=183268 RepID=A0A9W7MXV0_HIBTR|nr:CONSTITUTIVE EXPRESSER OF PR GENES 1, CONSTITUTIVE EXPRESSER OF PR GENES 30 [Hibiscus trionum]